MGMGKGEEGAGGGKVEKKVEKGREKKEENFEPAQRAPFQVGRRETRVRERGGVRGGRGRVLPPVHPLSRASLLPT